MNRFKVLAYTIVTLSIALFSFSAPILAADPSCGSSNDPKGQVLQGVGRTGSDCNDSDVNNAAASAVKILSIIVGIAAIIMILVSGFKYITSGGDSNKVASAKNTLIYALVGVIIAVLAQLLVNFVFTAATNAENNSTKSGIKHNDLYISGIEPVKFL